METRGIYIVLVLAGLVSCANAASPEAIDQAIASAKTYIYSQEKDGNWEEGPPPTAVPDNPQESQSPKNGQYTGRTALAVLALINAGESSSDPRIKSAVDFLMKTPTNGVYALGLRCQVWLLLPPSPAVRDAMSRDAKILEGSMKTEGVARGMYDYLPTPNSANYSHSRSQYAVLGMWAAEESGFEVPDLYWQIVEKAWIDQQESGGGWAYSIQATGKGAISATPGMTTVGVATLFITQENLRGNQGISCKGNQENPAITKGIKWLGDHMDKFATSKPYPRDFPYATLYAYERVGAASGYRYFGGIDWFEKGADWALEQQGKKGNWTTTLDAKSTSFSSLIDTCFATLFLAKGRAPVIFSKLHYTDAAGKDGNWNQRARDVANVTRWIGKTIEHDLAFQIVDAKASLEDLLETPILYISGNEAIDFSAADEAKIKAYIEGGGIVLANADCGGDAFVASIKKIGLKMFPDYEFNEVPAGDPMYTDFYPASKWKSKPSLLRLSNGARPLIYLLPHADAGKAWEMHDQKSKPELFELAADMVLSTIDSRRLRYRGSRFYVPEESGNKPAKTIDVCRLKYPGAWDPEPGGWRRMNNLMARQQSTGLKLSVAELGKDQIGKNKIAFLTGSLTYKFLPAQQDELKHFIDAGGTLIIDAAGGNGEVATSMEAMLQAMYPDQKLDLLPPDHPLFTAGGGNAEEITYRDFAFQHGIGHIKTPRLQGITLNGRLAVIYSREDLSVGMVGQEVDGVIGYSSQTATSLMTRILRFAAGVKAGK